MPGSRCPICQRPAATGGLNLVWVNCDRCGKFQISDTLITLWRIQRQSNNGQLQDPQQQKLLPMLSAATRQAISPLALRTDNWEEIAGSRGTTPVKQKLRRLLELIVDRTSAPGNWITVNSEFDAPLLDISSDAEFLFLITHLKQIGLVKAGAPDDTDGEGRPRHVSDSDLDVLLTVKGWEEGAPMAGGIAGTCFVAMSFDPSLNAAFEHGILPSVETDCGFRALRIDRVEHNDVITDRILAGIRSAQFVVADFTLQRQGVYYEAGFAQGLGRPVIWACCSDDRDNLHFDTRQFNHILWQNPADLRRLLTDRIRATIPGARLI